MALARWMTLLVVLVSPVWCKVPLNPQGIYGSVTQAQTCLSIAFKLAKPRLGGDVAANCLRFAFHDAGTYSAAQDNGGANGSILTEMQDLTAHPEDNGMQGCFAAIQQIVADIKNAGCPQITFADAIQVTGAAAVALKGGPTCSLLMGRSDSFAPDITSRLPSQCGSNGQLMATFTALGFADPAKALAVLSGAHNIGQDHVTTNCTRGVGPLTAAPNNFDGHYYNEVFFHTGRNGWLNSDRALIAPASPTVGYMQQFANNHASFLDAWCDQYREMSLLGVDPSPYNAYFGWDPLAITVNVPPAAAGQPPLAAKPPATPNAKPPAAPNNARPLAPAGGKPPAAPGGKPGGGRQGRML